ncbi:MAG: radical SAM protein [Chloroflexi bacterium]|nr:radical SAM protein [Chloroflexota bacterium]
MTKILLVAPPFYRLMGSHFNGMQLGISYIASYLAAHGHEVRIYDADFLDNATYLDQRGIFESYSTYKSTLGDLSHPLWEEVRKSIASYGPDVVGITMHTGTFKSCGNVARIAKQLDRGTKVIVGGTHPTLDAAGTLQCQDFDVAVRGEGEEAVLELVEGAAEREVLGLSYRTGEAIVAHNPDRPFISDLDALPFPSRDAFLHSEAHDIGYVITGRGCPFACTYCASPAKWRRTVRFRSVENVVAEIKDVLVRFEAPIFYFVDDTLTIDRERTKELCRRIIEEKLGIQWRCDTRADRLDRELVSLMKEAGCIRVKMGVESGSDRVLKQIRKGVTREQISRAVDYVKEFGIPLTVYLMVGFPCETSEDVRETVEFAKKLDADYYSLSVLAPYYGTQIYHEVHQNGASLDKEHWEYFFHQSGDMMVNDKIDKAVIEEFLALNERNGKGRRL